MTDLPAPGRAAPDRPSGPGCTSSSEDGERRREDRLATEEPLEIRARLARLAPPSGSG